MSNLSLLNHHKSAEGTFLWGVFPTDSKTEGCSDLRVASGGHSSQPDTADHSVLIQRWEHTVGIKVGIPRACLNHICIIWLQFLHVNEAFSTHAKVFHGFPRGSVLEPILFALYMRPLGNIIRKHGIFISMQMMFYLSVRSDNTNPLVKLQTKTWMTSNFLLLKSDRMCVWSKSVCRRHLNSITKIQIICDVHYYQEV